MCLFRGEVSHSTDRVEVITLVVSSGDQAQACATQHSCITSVLYICLYVSWYEGFHGMSSVCAHAKRMLGNVRRSTDASFAFRLALALALAVGFGGVLVSGFVLLFGLIVAFDQSVFGRHFLR